MATCDGWEHESDACFLDGMGGMCDRLWGHGSSKRVCFIRREEPGTHEVLGPAFRTWKTRQAEKGSAVDGTCEICVIAHENYRTSVADSFVCCEEGTAVVSLSRRV